MTDNTRARDDWARWSTGLQTVVGDGETHKVFPNPHDEGGLPSGWRIESQHTSPGGRTATVLVQHPDGGWLRVLHDRARKRSLAGATYQTLPDMYNNLLDKADEGKPAFVMMAAWVAEVLMRAYDPTVAEEAAEQMLLALGGRPTLSPSALIIPSPVPAVPAT